MKIGISVLCALLMIGSQVGAGQEMPAPRGLKAPLAHFVVQKKTLAEALQELASQALPNAVIGFEHVVAPPTAESPRIDVTVHGGTVSDALAAICSDGRYTYSESVPGVVEVRPSDEPAELRALMDLPIPSLDLDRQEWPGNLIGHIAERIPEVQAYLSAKVMEWSRKTGQPLPGAPGITMSGNVPPPPIKIQLRNTTVRRVLSAIAAYTLEHAPRDRSVWPFYSPTGWRVEFTPDPMASTGLGGYLRWSAFPFL